jgi:hypothetical protein
VVALGQAVVGRGAQRQGQVFPQGHHLRGIEIQWQVVMVFSE